MAFANSSERYGTITKALHWSVFLLFVYQYLGANLMTRIGRDGRFLGMGQNTLYDWHKSIGLVILALMVLRVIWRNSSGLPDWSPLLTESERRLSHRLEMMVYAMLFAMPISGYLFVMAGNYGVKLFGSWPLPNPIGKVPALATLSWILHVLFAYVAVVFIAWHVGHGLKKHLEAGGGFLERMLPQRRP